MKYTVTKARIDFIGGIWMPYGATCAQTKELSRYDLENIGEWTRENIEHWLMLNSGDFSSVKDFRADFDAPGKEHWESPWEDEESEFTFQDCMFPAED